MKSQNNLQCLTGSFLVSTQQMSDPRFEGQVIYLCSHGVDGALGMAINKPDEHITLAQVLREMGMGLPGNVLPPVYIGGPVSLDAAFILYRSGLYSSNGIDVTPTISLTREKDVLQAIAEGVGPKDYLFLLGYAGWQPGQLEAELRDNGWLVVPGDEGIIFDLPNEQKWQAAAMQYGIDIVTFNETIGYA